MARVVLTEVVSEADGIPILDRVSFVAEQGEFIGLIGSSGAGKTSVIRAIAGFDKVSSGSIHFDADDVTATPTRDRDVGVVSQANTLFPTERVRGNLSFPLRARGFGRGETKKRVDAESKANNIDHILERWPQTLSGGEQQLAQIARALVRRPQVFLMDEPLAKLDPVTKRRLRAELLTLQKGYGVTTIYVANRPDEIMTMPDRLVAIEHGRVIQIGTPVEVHHQPASLAVAQLTGDLGTLSVTLTRGPTGLILTGPGINLRPKFAIHERHIGELLTVAVRSSDVSVTTSGPITLVAAGLSYDAVNPVRELTSAAGRIATADRGVSENSEVTVRLDRWHLFDSRGHRVL